MARVSFLVELVRSEGGEMLARQGVTTGSVSARVGPYIYAAGICSRRGDDGSYSFVMAVLNIRQQKWQWVPYKGSFNEGAGMFLYDDRLFCLSTDINASRLTCFDLVLEEQTPCPSFGEFPVRRKYFCGHFLERLNRYVVFGGDYLPNKNEVFILDMPGCRWFKALPKGAPPQGRCHAGSCVHEGVIYIFGGYSHLRPIHNDGIHLLKVGSGQSVAWSSPRTNAVDFGPRYSSCLIPLGGMLLLCGGKPNPGTSKLSYYDPAKQEFKYVDLDDHLLRLFGSGACHSPIETGRSSAYLFGGIEGTYYVQIIVK